MITARVIRLEIIDLGLRGENDLICDAVLCIYFPINSDQGKDGNTGEDLFHGRGLVNH